MRASRNVRPSSASSAASTRSESDRHGVHYASLFLLLLLIVQFAVSFRPSALAWDGIFYYIYTRSAVFDGDLELGNDLLLSYDVTPAADFIAERFEQHLTPTGRVGNPFAIGTSLLWMPWFTVVYGLARLAQLVGVGPDTLTGYEWYFTVGMATVTCVYGWVAILTGFRLVRRFVSDWAAVAASATLMFATPLYYYQFREPFYAHAASAMMTALFVSVWWRTTTRGHREPGLAFLVGMLGGLAALVRSQNITYLMLPALMSLTDGWRALQERKWQAVLRSVARVLSVGLGALLILTLQLIVWYIFYGRVLGVPQGAAFVDWSAPWMEHVLLSAFHGLLPWMPLTLPAVIGLILLARRAPRLSVPLIAALVLQVYVNGSVKDWFGGGGYGARRFSNALIVLLVGYAYLLNWRKEWWYRVLAVALSGLLVLHQWLLLRYGFADQIGGHVVSMPPDYRWHADSITHFLQQLAGYIPVAISNPVQTVILSGSPLKSIHTSSTVLLGQFLLLLGALGTLFLLQAGWRYLANGRTVSPAVRRLFAVGAVTLTLLADWWLLQRA